MKTRIISRVALAMLLVCAINSFGQSTGRIISYQGSLEENSRVVNGNHKITVTLYADPIGNIPIWTDTYETQVENGLFNIQLGFNTKLPDNKSLDRQLWVGVRVNSGEELRPLTKLGVVPYAINVADKAITKDKLDDELLKLVYSAESNQKPQTESFNNITSGQNTVANMDVGSGATLFFSGSGTIDANKFNFASGTDAVDLGTAEVAGTLPVARGGTGAATFTGSGILLGNGTSAITALSPGGAGTVLQIVGTAPAYATVSLGPGSSSITGTLPIANGGTGSTSEIYWKNSGNAYSQASGDFIGTTSGGGNFELRVKGDRVMRYVDGFGSTPCILGGWKNNVIGATYGATIAGGGSDGAINTINADYAFIGGGSGNTVKTNATHAVIVGGGSNTINADSDLSFIGGGVLNVIGDASNIGHKSTIVGGYSNRIFGQRGFIGGGTMNTITAGINLGMIGGGTRNTIKSDYGTIGGGDTNSIRIDAEYSFIGGGARNVVESDYGTVSGGDGNFVKDDAGYSTISGGIENNIDAPYSTIGGGMNNSIYDIGFTSTIGGGINNQIGVSATSTSAVVAGGENNYINLGNYSTISGGLYNEVNAQRATIGGGLDNIIGAAGGDPWAGSYATIPGGHGLVSESYAQTVVGRWNEKRGNTTVFETASKPLDPLLVVGNGSYVTSVRSNAFEVSRNGHSVVFHTNGGSGALPNPAAIHGATYRDNIIYGWGEIDAAGTVTGTNSFAIASVVRNPLALGDYTITLASDNTNLPPAATASLITNGVVNITLRPATDCFFNVSASPIANNVFTVHVRRFVNPATGGLLCMHPLAEDSYGFMFIATGRP